MIVAFNGLLTFKIVKQRRTKKIYKETLCHKSVAQIETYIPLITTTRISDLKLQITHPFYFLHNLIKLQNVYDYGI